MSLLAVTFILYMLEIFYLIVYLSEPYMIQMTAMKSEIPCPMFFMVHAYSYLIVVMVKKAFEFLPFSAPSICHC